MIKTEPPSFPLEAPAFAEALARGLGRALLQVQRYGVRGLEDALLHYVLQPQAYDPQCEDSKAPWLAEILDGSGLKEKAVSILERAFENGQLDANLWGFEEQAWLLQQLALRGASGSRELLYRMLRRMPDSADVLAAEAIVELDGIDGLIRVARFLGQCLEQDPQFWVEDFHLADIDKRLGSGTAKSALEAVSPEDASIRRYLQAIESRQEAQQAGTAQRETLEISAEEVLERLRSRPPKRGPWMARWGRKANPAQRLLIFENLLQETDPELASGLLKVFRHVPLPRFDERLLPWLEAEDSRHAAIQALAQLSDSRIREEALRLIHASAEGFRFVPLLTHTFREGDAQRLAEILTIPNDPEELHGLGFGLLDLAEANPVQELADWLMFVYQSSPCSLCRTSAVRSLQSLGPLPQWMTDEIRFDADRETRSLASQGRHASIPNEA